MGISLHPCKVTMPPERTDCATVLEFLISQFSKVDESIWRQRIAEGKIHWDDKTPVTETDAYAPYKRVFYYREVEQEPEIPFQETIIFQNDEILVACKPHFLPVTPAGIYVQECLLNRLRKYTGIEALAPMHRIDRETAGIVLFSVNPKTRHRYHKLFSGDKLIHKTYKAIGRILADNKPYVGQEWNIENRIVEGDPWFRMTTEAGEKNAHSVIRCLTVSSDKALFELSPLTGKTHQLRLHMSNLGYPLMNDRLYPELQPKSPDNFEKPLQLLAHKLEFVDPVTHEKRFFESDRTLMV
ncbi:pseudouridine synthase [Parendozoicomonas sp. Alg238-R29]|uniref:pseudouridine synthase n=1 Tax=Parendozoicomonas sp. Alg238-R29 TaxID=2993446 RepID=UPI00248D77AB|nr:pseudouridine synthase [Parendozoicomonas sp. Alg238-R29]